MFQNRNEKIVIKEIDEQVCIPEIVSKRHMKRKKITISMGYVKGWTYEITTHISREGILNRGIGSFNFREPGKCAGFYWSDKEKNLSILP